jgi:hypothetical protein
VAVGAMLNSVNLHGEHSTENLRESQGLAHNKMVTNRARTCPALSVLLRAR